MNNSKEARPTQQFVEINKISNGTVVLKSGALRKILMVNGLNFELKSEDEQSIIIKAYQDFINSLDFSLQIIIQSRKSNTEKYIENLISREKSEENELLKDQLSEYVQFISSFIRDNEIMAKNFFVSVPYNPTAIPIKGAAGIFGGIFGKSKNTQDQNKIQSDLLEEQISQLNQRVEQVVNGLAGAGLRAVPLNDEELVELFYNLYNPKFT